MRRTALSRPAQLLLDQNLIGPETTLLDYGCGHGDDVKRLTKKGFTAAGWDPHFFPDNPLEAASVVNLGFVLNVIEDRQERNDVLRKAFDLSRNLLLVSVQPLTDVKEGRGRPFGDGYLTGIGTFQKYYDQTELKNWVSSTLSRRPVPLAPGVLAVFTDDEDRQAFVVSRLRRRLAIRSERRANEYYDVYQELLDDFFEVFTERGRPPMHEEWDRLGELHEKLGSSRRAMSVLGHVYGLETLDEIRTQRSEDLLVFLALELLEGRPRFSELAESIRKDIRVFFGAYKKACAHADHLLFSAGNPLLIDAACRDSGIGKLTPAALYVHTSALEELEPVLRVYEGCARFMIGEIEGANVIKLRRGPPAISYLIYPKFERVGHPELEASYHVDLRELRAKFQDYSTRKNPPILHRKDEMMGPTHQLRKRFERLTRAEERAGLFEDTATIGLKKGWLEKLEDAGFQVRGHRLYRVLPPDP